MSFQTSTRLKVQQLATLTKPTGGGKVSCEIPRVGIVSHILLSIPITVSGTLSNQNANGFCSAIRRVTLRLNSGHTLFDVSGLGYHYLVRDMLGGNGDLLSYTTARSTITATTATLDMIIPISFNMRDEIGLIMLQNGSTLLTLEIDWEADATVATGATVTGTCVPFVYYFEVPSNSENWPNFDTLHQIIEEQISISGAMTYQHQIARGATLVGQYYYTSGTTYTAGELRVQQSNVIEQFTPEGMRLRFALTNERSLTLASPSVVTGYNNRVFLDFAGTDGHGQFGTVRDVLDTQALTSIFTNLTIAGAGTLYAIRRQIAPLT